MSTLNGDVAIDPHPSIPSNDSLPGLAKDDYLIASSPSSPFRSTDILLSPLIAEDLSRRPHVRKLQNVTYWSGVSLIVGNQIGAGIFSSPSLVNRNAGSVGMSLIVWIVAGCFAWAGACKCSLSFDGLITASYAELGSAIPLNGGARVYLDRTFGPVFGFLFSWTTISAVKPASLGIVSIIFAEYINRVLFQSLKSTDASPVLADKVVALLCVWVIIALQSMGSRWGTALNNLFTFLKVTILLAIAVIGMFVLGRLQLLY
jgi:amino acid transporter